MNFWQQLPKPIFALAPMEAVTDVAFREIFAKYGKPDVMFTEFINVDGILHPEGFERLKVDLRYTEKQRPIVAQIWGRDPEKFYKAAQLIASLGFDGVDINFGCPQDKEVNQKTCAALIREPALAREIIEATIQGAQISHTPAYGRLEKRVSGEGQGTRESGGGVPVSVKTRLGYSSTDEMEGWIRQLLTCDIAALTLHGRIKKEKSKVPAHWEKIAEAVKIRDEMYPVEKAVFSRPIILGNGDIQSREEGMRRVQETGCDGVMIARGSFGNPWLFRLGGKKPEKVFSLPTSRQAGTASLFHGYICREVNSTANSLSYVPTIQERLSVMLEHAELYEKELGGKKPFLHMRKNFKAYCSGFEGAGELRAKLMEVKNTPEARALVDEYLSKN